MRAHLATDSSSVMVTLRSRVFITRIQCNTNFVLLQSRSNDRRLGEGFEEEGQHAVAGDVGEGGEFEGVMAAGELEGAWLCAVATEGIEHLAGELGQHGGVVLAIDHES